MWCYFLLPLIQTVCCFMCGIAALMLGSAAPALQDWLFRGLSTAPARRATALPDAEALLAALERRGRTPRALPTPSRSAPLGP
jgi:hypothetical protein